MFKRKGLTPLFLQHRGIELPLHDTGLEPVEFLKSMGISLTPLTELISASQGSASKVNLQVLVLFISVYIYVYIYTITKGTSKIKGNF